MRLRRAQRRFGYEVNIAPLIDVVFLLIIFFMTVSQISRVEVVPLELPEAAMHEKPLSGRLIINVSYAEDKTSHIVVEGREHSVESLHKMLSVGAETRRPGDVSVLIRGDRRVPWSTAARVFQTCTANRIDRVHIAVAEPGGAPEL